MRDATPVLTTTNSQRLHGLDGLRGLALLLGLVVHASLAFMPGAQAYWITHDARPAEWIGLGFYVPHMFRMLLFFVLAGFFGRLALQRLGTRAFVRDRGKRITAVLLAGWPLVMTGIVIALSVGALLDNGGTLPPAPPSPPLSARTFPLTHLWFLYVLTLCYAGMLIVRALLARLPWAHTLTRAGDGLTTLLCSRVGPVLLAAPLAIALALLPQWYAFFGIPTPDQSLYPNGAACIAFGSAFVFGWCLHRLPQAWSSLARAWPQHLMVALACTVICLWLLGGGLALVPAPREPRTWIYAALYALGGWSWTLGLFGLALRCQRASAWRRYLADASYWIYLAHLPVVMLLQVLAVRLMPGPAGLKWAVVIVLSLGLLLASYGLFVRTTWLGAWLNGRRHARRWS